MASLKVKISLTNKCLNKCSFCYLGEKKKEKEIISNENILKISDFIEKEYKKYSIIRLVLSGGDATLHPEFINISNYFKNKFKDKIQIRSEFSETSDLNVINKYLELGYFTAISLNENSIKTTFDICKKFKDKKQSLGILVTLSDYNINRIGDICNSIVDYGLVLRLGSVYDPNISKDRLNQLIDCLDEAGNILVKRNYKYWNYLFAFMSIDKPRHSYCGYGENYYYFTPNGDYKRCPMDEVIGNISDKEISIQKQINYKEECLNCKYFEFCRSGCHYSNQFHKYCELYKKSFEVMRRIKDGYQSS